MTMTKDGMDRREFTAASVMALLSGVTVVISGCGGGGGGSSYTGPTPVATPTPGAGDKSGAISENHGHVATITAAQITAAGAIVLNIMGSADHNHTVTITASDLMQIGTGAKIARSSSNATASVYGAHDHTVTFNP
jgi:hypothetical protein